MAKYRMGILNGASRATSSYHLTFFKWIGSGLKPALGQCANGANIFDSVLANHFQTAFHLVHSSVPFHALNLAQ